MSTVPPPPPPPEDPFPSFTSDQPDPYIGDGGPTLDQGKPSVAANPGRVATVLGVVGVVLLFLLYQIFFAGGKEEEKDPNEGREITTAPITPPSLPIQPPPVFTPPAIPEPAKVDLIKPEDDSAEREQLLARMRSSMVIKDGGGALSSVLGDDNRGPASDDPNSQFESRIIASNTKAEKTVATSIGDLRRVIAQGRLIQATMESAINTDLPAPIRAIVSRDTYGEAGSEPLIPKGSRLIGQYSTSVLAGQSRVFVVWTRVIRPDGVDVALGSPLVDRIGQAGIGGQVDSKFQQIFSRAIMASVVAIGFAIASDEVVGGETSTSTSTFGTTQSGSGATTATVNALNRLGSISESFLQRFLNVKPTILVDQGTPVNVFVNRDLIFPAELVGTRVIN